MEEERVEDEERLAAPFRTGDFDDLPELPASIQEVVESWESRGRARGSGFAASVVRVESAVEECVARFGVEGEEVANKRLECLYEGGRKDTEWRDGTEVGKEEVGVCGAFVSSAAEIGGDRGS